MEKSKRHILSTRPLSEAIINEAARQQVFIDIASFIQTAPVKNPELAEQINLLAHKKITAVFTSMNAVEAVAAVVAHKVNWAVYCIGATTQKLVAQKLTGNITGTAESAAELAGKIIADDVQNVVFFCGNIRRDELPAKLSAAHIPVQEVVVYETAETPVETTKVYDGILFFSPSAVRSFFSINTVSEQTVLFAIGKTTAEALQQFSTNKISIAGSTGKDELLRHALAYFQQQFHANR